MGVGCGPEEPGEECKPLGPRCQRRQGLSYPRARGRTGHAAGAQTARSCARSATSALLCWPARGTVAAVAIAMNDKQATSGIRPAALARAAYFGSAHFTAAAAVVAGGLVASAFWSSGRHGGLLLWVAALAGVAVLRSSSALAFNRGWLAQQPERLHELLAWVVPALMGSVWGLGGWWMLGFGEPGQVLVLISFSIGAVMGSISNAVYWPAHVGFFVPLMGLLVIGLLDHPRPESPVLIGGAVLITALMAVQGRALGRRLGEALSLAHENQQLAHRLATLSHTDALTGLPNRRAWDERLAGEWARARREAHALGMLVIDVDHFKQFND
ncbi:MAG: diguanylate cyclase, partial [Burkholderiales bacterium]|nr:diguanylate cyclase [Burkholderiales bacterium]